MITVVTTQIQIVNLEYCMYCQNRREIWVYNEEDVVVIYKCWVCNKNNNNNK